MIIRKITGELTESAHEYPVVTIFGPRQSGKTTLAKMTFPDKAYASLEDPDVRIAAETDPRGFLAGFPQGGIIDEIQRIPQLLSYIQGIVDQTNIPGFYILTGSHQPELKHAVSQTLAGRTSVLTLLPFSVGELKNYHHPINPFQLMIQGMYPAIHEKNLKSSRFFNNYYQTYIERDVQALIKLKDLRQFQQFIKLIAGRIGQVVNYTSLSNDIGVSSTTIKNWISVLKASYVIFELNPYFSNLRKRVIKSPKVYFTDIGLACYLCNISTIQQLERDPLRGGLFENFVILEFLKSAYNHGIYPDLYFYRDSHGTEVDLLVQKEGTIFPIEIKSSLTFTKDFLKGILSFGKYSPESKGKGFVLYLGDQSYALQGIQVRNPFMAEDFWGDFFQ